jgi:hypothetical protein
MVLSPSQKIAGVTGVIVASAMGSSLISNGADSAEHPLESVTRTLYDPPVPTRIVCVVAPVDQRYET